MSFSLIGIFAVILEVVRPYLGLIGLLAILIELGLVISCFRKGNKQQCSFEPKTSDWRWHRCICCVVAIVPMLTGARHSNLASVIDYLALFGVSLGEGNAVALVIWPLLHVVTQSPAQTK